jgi:D-alanyl-D-alanine carboxypeptidase
MKKILFGLMALILLISSCKKDNPNTSTPDEFVNTPLSAAYTNRLNEVFDSACNAMNIKGASAAILVPRVGLWKRTYGFSHANVPINTNMAMTIGSNTKTYIGVLMLKLQELNLLNINDTIGKWIINKPYVNGKVTIKQLLNHTSGFGDFSFNPNFINAIKVDLNKIWNPEEVYPFFEPPYFTPPGSNHTYSDQNYFLAGMIIKAVTQKPVEKALREYILTPYNLPNTVYYPFEPTTLTIPHSWSADFNSNNTFEDLVATYGYTIKPFCSADNAAGGMLSTAEENVRFWNLITSGKILTPSSYYQFKDFVDTDIPGQGYGLGIVRQINGLNSRTVYFHDGYVPGSINTNAVDRETGVCFSILTNQDLKRNLVNITSALHKVIIKQ